MAADQLTPAFIGVGGVIVGAVMVWAKDWFTLRWKRKNEARFLAIRVVCILDQFIDDCVSVARDNGVTARTEQGEPYREFDNPLPTAPSFPNDIDWKSIDHRLAYEILSLPSDVEWIERGVRFILGMNWPPFQSEFDERQLEYAQLAIKVLAITDKLRKKYKIPSRENAWWEADGFIISSHIEKIKERQRIRSERDAK